MDSGSDSWKAKRKEDDVTEATGNEDGVKSYAQEHGPEKFYVVDGYGIKYQPVEGDFGRSWVEMD
jgi:hypothetical protein